MSGGAFNRKVRDVERPQPQAGRLDLLLREPDTGKRYEVELMLGAVDESHIIRNYLDLLLDLAEKGLEAAFAAQRFARRLAMAFSRRM